MYVTVCLRRLFWELKMLSTKVFLLKTTLLWSLCFCELFTLLPKPNLHLSKAIKLGSLGHGHLVVPVEPPWHQLVLLFNHSIDDIGGTLSCRPHEHESNRRKKNLLHEIDAGVPCQVRVTPTRAHTHCSNPLAGHSGRQLPGEESIHQLGVAISRGSMCSLWGIYLPPVSPVVMSSQVQLAWIHQARRHNNNPVDTECWIGSPGVQSNTTCCMQWVSCAIYQFYAGGI